VFVLYYEFILYLENKDLEAFHEQKFLLVGEDTESFVVESESVEAVVVPHRKHVEDSALVGSVFFVGLGKIESDLQIP